LVYIINQFMFALSKRNWMKKMILPWIFVLLAFATAMAQTTVKGTVKDNRNRPLTAVSVTLLNSYDGATTDSLGKFSFTTTEKGTFIIEAKSVGYATATQSVNISKEPIQLSFILKEEISELKAVTVTAGSFEAGDKKRTATVLSALDIYTTGGANADITSAVKTLPGAQQVGEQEGLFVRGGAGYETKQMIDGMVVNNPFFTGAPDIATRGRFSPSLFKGNVFSTGGYSALYGQALSSVLLLESIDLPDRSEASASITTVFVGAGFQHLDKNKKSSYGINYGYTNLLPYFSIVKQKPDYFAMPEFHSSDANFRIKTKRGGMIKFYTTFATTKLGLRNTDIDSSALKNAFGLNNLNWYNNLSYRENLGKGWKMQLGLSYSTNVDKINNTIQNQLNQPVTTTIGYIDGKNFALKSTQDLSQARAVFEKRIKGISAARFGAEYWFANNKTEFGGFTSTLKDHFTSVFGEVDFYITNGLALKTGARFEHSSILKKANIAPRLSLAYKAGNNAQMSLAYGEFYQKPENNQLINNATGNPLQLGYTKATHYLVNYIKTTNLQTFRIEAYYKKYNNLVKTFPDTNTLGTGYAQGFEIFWRDKKSIKNIDYWISYSYLDTKRDFLNYPTQMQPTFATPHTFNLVTKTFVTKWKTGFNATYTFATGRPYYDIAFINSKFEIRDQGTTKNFHNLGFSLNYLPNLGKQNAKTFIVLVASVTNALNFNQEFGYRYSYNGQNKVAVTPPAKQFFFIGCFLSWGVDKSQDAINNNL